MKRFYGLHNDLLHLIDGMLKLNQNSSSVAHNNNYAFILQPESDFVAMAVNVRPMRTEGKSEGRDCVGSACISVSIFPIRLNVFLFVGVFDATQFCNCNWNERKHESIDREKKALEEWERMKRIREKEWGGRGKKSTTTTAIRNSSW